MQSYPWRSSTPILPTNQRSSTPLLPTNNTTPSSSEHESCLPPRCCFLTCVCTIIGLIVYWIAHSFYCDACLPCDDPDAYECTCDTNINCCVINPNC